VKQLDSVESTKWIAPKKSLSMNVFCLRGIAFIPDNNNADIDQEIDVKMLV
jgi:hypothetical protein